MEVEKCISPIGGRLAIENEAAGEGSYTDQTLERLKFDTGLETVQAASIGVYHYKVVEGGQSFSTCTIVSRGGPKNHTIYVTDQGFEPKVVTIHPGDRIWWVWQEGTKQHNIIQVSHQGNHIPGGFSSGTPMDCPSAFMHQYQKPGVYYYIR
ncbi:hypothetical protein LSH36_114g03020 [Paralvinella palmiformis]|uniref:Uncharacterized protein n=1 Tax=Paralvinella palmiformis TaxID=53620 RepID=A0AAD9N922_9ANNE|nr:hypothetical protein LSH36_114g03020 [Paralvinella palmiformis]